MCGGGKRGGVWWGECVWGASAVEFGGVGGCVGQARWSLVGWVGVWTSPPDCMPSALVGLPS